MTLADNLLAFTLAATVLTITPGLDTALILRTSAVEGRAQGLRAALGINAGCFIWGAAVAFGLGALIAVSELAYDILKYCGAAYLAWLGLNMLLRPRQSLAPAEQDARPTRNWFLRGMLGNLLNPKIGSAQSEDRHLLCVVLAAVHPPRGTADHLDLWPGSHSRGARPALAPARCPVCCARARWSHGWIAPPACCSSCSLPGWR